MIELVEMEEAKVVELEKKTDEMNAKLAKDKEEIKVLKEDFAGAYESMAQFRGRFEKMGVESDVNAED